MLSFDETWEDCRGQSDRNGLIFSLETSIAETSFVKLLSLIAVASWLLLSERPI